MNINEIAEITGVSVRTLHHYDEISLLIPSRNPENSYREYTDNDIDKLQQILFFKECGFTLARIKELFDSPAFDREKAFELQRKYLLQERKRIDSMIGNIEKSIKNMKGEVRMNQKEKFNGFDFSNNPYEEEARRLWGNEAVDQSNTHIASLSEEERSDIAKKMNDLFISLAEIRNEDPSSKNVQEAMDGMYNHFNSNFGGNYTLEAFSRLGEMYVTDDRFTKNIDQYGEGLSEFLAKAMKIYSENKR